MAVPSVYFVRARLISRRNERFVASELLTVTRRPKRLTMYCHASACKGTSFCSQKKQNAKRQVAAYIMETNTHRDIKAHRAQKAKHGAYNSTNLVHPSVGETSAVGMACENVDESSSTHHGNQKEAKKKMQPRERESERRRGRKRTLFEHNQPERTCAEARALRRSASPPGSRSSSASSLRCFRPRRPVVAASV